jgi:transposase
VVAAEIGVREATVYRWREQDRVDRGERPGLSSVERVELAQARRRIRETELEITRKASALFAEGEVRPKESVTRLGHGGPEPHMVQGGSMASTVRT